MNIKGQMIECIKTQHYFAGYTGQKILEKAIKMLRARKYSTLKRYATEMMKSVLKTHNKGQMIMPSLNELYNTEVYKFYESKKYQRLHFMHQPYVFLLGLFIYHNCATVKDYILNEMEETTECIADNPNRYSDGDCYEEFLYRWRLACLIHDIGYSISLFNDDNKTEVDCLNEIFKPYGISFKEVLDLRYFKEGEKEKNLISDLETNGKIKLSEYIASQIEHPQHRAIYDHGIVSALILLQLIEAELLKPHPEKKLFGIAM